VERGWRGGGEGVERIEGVMGRSCNISSPEFCSENIANYLDKNIALQKYY